MISVKGGHPRLDIEYIALSYRFKLPYKMVLFLQLFADFMNKVFELRQKYIGFSFVALAATDEGYSLY